MNQIDPATGQPIEATATTETAPPSDLDAAAAAVTQAQQAHAQAQAALEEAVANLRNQVEALGGQPSQ